MIKLEKLTISYEDNLIFEDLGYCFESGKIHGILGVSGCGKSTLLRGIAGLIKPKKGKIIYDETEIHSPHEEICMMHQKYVNFPWLTCLDNILIGKNMKSKKMDKNDPNILKAYKILNQVGLGDYANRYPHELSGGMNQRLALSRVLYREPKVILMDEPLSALDPNTRQQMQILIMDLHYKINNTIIMVTHDPDEAKKMCNRIMNLSLLNIVQ